MFDPESEPRTITSAQWTFAALVIAFAVGSVIYKTLRHQQLGHSAAMFIGIPAILAIILALTPKAKSATGAIIKGITLALLIIAPLLGEGYLCILVASPLFYLVGIVIGAIVDYGNRRERERKATLSCLAIILLPMSLEGVLPQLTFHRNQTVEATRIVNLPAKAVEQSLAQSPNIHLPLRGFLSIGFPRPLQATGSGLTIGGTRVIHFSGAEGDPPGDLTLRVAEHRSNYLRFEAVSDTSKLTQWITWQNSEVEWFPIDSTHTQVTWRVTFNRQLDPAWYFTPWERFAVRQAAQYLITATTATPEKF